MTAALVCFLVSAICWALLAQYLRHGDREIIAALNEALTASERDLQTANASARANRALAEARNDAMSEYSAHKLIAELDYRLLVSSARCLPDLADDGYVSRKTGPSPIYDAARRAAA